MPGGRPVDNNMQPQKRRKPLLTHVIDPKLRKSIGNYVFQSVLATLICCIMLISLGIIPKAIVASLGASTFIVFVAPDTRSARPRGLLGGQLIGTGVGLVCGLILQWQVLSFMQVSERMELALLGSIAVGLAIFLMVIIDMEHPPAAGTALSLVIEYKEWDMYSIAFIAGASIFLSVTRWVLRRYLKNLY